jgi:2-C-methyl-D-erythritol 4-phosphate cytidylyltransferase
MALAGAVAVVPAAGLGKRLGENKPFAEILGKPLLRWTVEALEASPGVARICLVLKEEDMARGKDLLGDIPKLGGVINGGPERQDSVMNALRQLRETLDDKDIVLVHDGARPLVTDDIIYRCITGLVGYHGCIAAVPPKDTVKETDGGDVVACTLRRDSLMLVQTPQAFPFSTLLAAYTAAKSEGFTATDDSAVVEWAGGRVRVVMGSYENIKVTTPEDLEAAEIFLKRRGA